MVSGLVSILLLVLLLPFAVKKVEHNLELFLFIMGLAATLISGVWLAEGEFNTHLLQKALQSPLMITGAVFVAGILFKILQDRIKSLINSILDLVSYRVFFFIVVVVLGLASSFITAIIAALVLVEIVNALGLERREEVQLDIIACFAIGMGAALTPAGEPLSTIAISKLGQDFWYLFRLLGAYIVPGVIALAILAALVIRPNLGRDTLSAPKESESYQGVVIRALKVYLFVTALELLGEGFKPMIDLYVLGLSGELLYWINMVSAVLDNATLTAAEISNKMSPMQVKSILMGLLVSGGMLIPGNIPNIISAGKLKIGSKEWAKLGVPLGLAMMLTYFLVIEMVFPG